MDGYRKVFGYSANTQEPPVAEAQQHPADDSDEEVALSDVGEGEAVAEHSDDDVEYANDDGSYGLAAAPTPETSADGADSGASVPVTQGIAEVAVPATPEPARVDAPQEEDPVAAAHRQAEEAAAVAAAAAKVLERDAPAEESELPAELSARNTIDNGLPRETNEALASVNFIVNRKPTLDTDVLQGCTPENLRQKLGELISQHSVHLSAEHELIIDDLARALQPAVRKLAAEQHSPQETAPPEPREQQQQQQQQQEEAAEEEEEEPAAPSAPAEAEQQKSAQLEATEAPAPAPSLPVERQSSAPAPEAPTEGPNSGAAEEPAPAPSAAGTEPAVAPPAAAKKSAEPAPAAAESRPAAAPRGGLGLLPARPARRTTGAMPMLPPRPAASSGGPPPANGRTTPPDAAAGNGPTAPSAAGTGTSAPAANTPPAANHGPSLPARPAAANPAPAANGGAAFRRVAETPAAPAAAAVAAQAEEEEDETTRALRRKVHELRVTLMRVAMRLHQGVRSSIINQVVYRLDVAERIRIPSRAARRVAPLEAAVAEAQRLEDGAGPESELPFTATMLVVGVSGTGKTATINSLLGRGSAAGTSAYQRATKKVEVVEGLVNGMRLRFIDTPGLLPAASKVAENQRILNQAKKAMDKYKPDLVLYVDRMDLYRRDAGDLPILQALTNTFGAEVWFNTILAVTHASVAPPDGNSGPISYDMFTNHRMHLLQQTIRQAAGDMRLLNPVALVENHPNCRTNREGDPVLPNGVAWKGHLLLLALSSKLLKDADSLLKIQPGRGANSAAMAMFRGQKLPPIPYLISNMVTAKKPRHPPEDERDVKRDDEIASLAPEQQKGEIRKKREFIRLRQEEARAEGEAQSQVAIPAPEPALPPTFDADTTSHRYRYLESAGGWINRPFVEQHSLDHDDGVDGFSSERQLMLRPKGQYLGGVPAVVSTQIHKDKNQFTMQAEAEGSYYHSSRVITTAGTDMQTIGSDVIFVGRAETRIKLHPKDKAALGVTVARLKENGGLPTSGPVAYGAKIENRIKIKRGLKTSLAAGIMTTKTRTGRETALAANADLKHQRDSGVQLLVGTSMMRFRKDTAVGVNASAQFNATRQTQVASRVNLHSKGNGTITVRVTSHDKPELAYSLLVPILAAIWGKIRGGDDALY